MANLVETLMGLVEPGLTVATRADTARMQGQQAGQDRKRADLLARLQEERDADDRQRAIAKHDLEMENTRSLIADRERVAPPAPETFGVPFEATGPEGAGLYTRGNLGTVQRLPGITPPAKAPPPKRQQIVGGQIVDLDTGQATPIKGYTPPPARTTLPTEGERKAAGFYKSGKYGYDALERIIKGDNPATPEIEVDKNAKAVPGFWASARQKIGMGVGNVMTSDQVRQMRATGLMLSDAWLRYTSGAAVPEQEVERFRDSFIPQPGDDDGTLALKAEARKVIIDALRDGAGRALNVADDAQFDAALQRIQALDPQAAQLMQRLRMRAGTQPTGADGLDAQIDAVLSGGRP